MNVDAIVISDSSDDDIPKKKIKKQHPDECNINYIRILKVTSLADTENANNSEIVITDDEDEVKHRNEIDAIKINDRENEHNTEGENKYLENNHKLDKICNTSDDTEHINEMCDFGNESGSNIALHIKNEKNDGTENISVTDTVHQKREIGLEFLAFLDQCTSCECDRKYKDLINKKLQNIKERYSQVNPEFVKDKRFIKLLKTNVERIQRKPADAIICFNDIWDELGARKERDDINLTDKESIHLNKLNKVLRLLSKKIKKLEDEPVNWDDDNNSSYMQLERYRKRFCDIHKKICSYVKENPFAGRSMYRKLDFDESKYPVINRAIEKLYNKTKSFPTFYEVDKCVRKCVQDNNLNTSGDLLDLEIRKVFTAVGKLLQRRRKNELHTTLNDFLNDPNDPALDNVDLKSVLDKQHKDGEDKIEAVLQKYTDKQEAGENPSVSSDSDDSNDSNQESETSDTVV